ncbi:hypothetical protein WJX77_000613 [Trebouxia sp. C0004]
MAAAQPRIKLQFEGILGEHLMEHDLQKCWYQLPAVSKKGSAMQSVSDLITKLCEAFDLLGAGSDLLLELDGFTVISNSPLSLFRDGDTVIIRSKGQKATVPVTNGARAEGGKRKRSEAALALQAAEDQQIEVSRPKKRKKAYVSATGAAEAAPAVAATSDASSEQEAVPVITHGEAGESAEAPATASQKKRKKRRQKNQTQIPETGEAAELSQPAGGDASLADGDALGTTEDAPGTTGEALGTTQDALGTSGDASQGAGDAPTEDKRQSRSARRKQLKRRYRRLGVAPPQAPISPHPTASVTPALAAAAEASPFDPNGAQPHQGTLAPHVTQDSTPAKRLKTQSTDAAQPAKTQLRARPASDAPGHVHFADSDSESASESDDDNGNEILPPAPTHANGKPATAQKQPADPQSSSQGQDSPKGKADPGSGSGAVPDGPPAKPGPASDVDRAGPSVALPESDAECAALPAVQGYPRPGDIVAYKLLEIGADWAPEVSEWRHGEVGEADLAGAVVIKPLAGQGSQTLPSAEANGHAEEEEEEEEGPPSNYDEHGILTTELPAFSELRLIKASPIPANPPAAPPAAPTAPLAGTAAQLPDFQDGILLDTGKAASAVIAASSQSGITAVAAVSGSIVPKVGFWADLSDQIARRKAELASGSDRADSDKKGTDSMDSSKQQQEQRQQQEQMLEVKSVNIVPGINTPGAVRPRGGVRASAMGPMLAHLRSSGAFETNL